MSRKLEGSKYREFWVKRARIQGEMYVGHVDFETTEELQAQADKFWRYLETVLPDKPKVVTEFGCGWGRMTKRLKQWFPDALVQGVDMVPSAIELARSQYPNITFALDDQYPIAWPQSDLIVTCTALQHVTDPEIFERVVKSLREGLKPGGELIMIERIGASKAPHVSSRTELDYERAFKGFTFASSRRLPEEFGEYHMLMRATSPA